MNAVSSLSSRPRVIGWYAILALANVGAWNWAALAFDGFVIIAFFVLSWIGSVFIYRVKGFDRVELPTGLTAD